MKISGLAETLFSDYRRRILGLLLLRPDEHFHVREISRLTTIPPGSLHRELKMLAEVGFLTRHTVGNQVRYQANQDCPIYSELAAIFRKTSGIADILRAALLPLVDSINCAFVFGSVARGEERATSDVDLCIVGAASFTDVVLAVKDMRLQLGRDINPVVITPDQFMAKITAGEQFVTRIMSEPKIFLVGTEHDLGKFAESGTDRPA